MDQGTLVYDYNMMIIENYEARSAAPIPGGKRKIEVVTKFQSSKRLSPADVTISVDGKEVAKVTVERTVPGAFTASETFDVGVDLGSPVAQAYAERRPFKFNGKIESVLVDLGTAVEN